MTPDDLALLKTCNASLGLMVETTSTRLRGKGHAHSYAPDKEPALRLAVLEEAGRQRIPFTTGLLIGIGETPEERVETLVAIADVARRFGGIQEVIVPSFRATGVRWLPATTHRRRARPHGRHRSALRGPVPTSDPPNLSPDALAYLLDGSINDFGGISPLTPDYVNQEAPWPTSPASPATADARATASRAPAHLRVVDRRVSSTRMAQPYSPQRPEIEERNHRTWVGEGVSDILVTGRQRPPPRRDTPGTAALPASPAVTDVLTRSCEGKRLGATTSS
jgi:7,8-didemethyl-8-hydroxy-5-deazariboflavin synthase CofG subunit